MSRTRFPWEQDRRDVRTPAAGVTGMSRAARWALNFMDDQRGDVGVSVEIPGEAPRAAGAAPGMDGMMEDPARAAAPMANGGFMRDARQERLDRFFDINRPGQTMSQREGRRRYYRNQDAMREQSGFDFMREQDARQFAANEAEANRLFELDKIGAEGQQERQAIDARGNMFRDQIGQLLDPENPMQSLQLELDPATGGVKQVAKSMIEPKFSPSGKHTMSPTGEVSEVPGANPPADPIRIPYRGAVIEENGIKFTWSDKNKQYEPYKPPAQDPLDRILNAGSDIRQFNSPAEAEAALKAGQVRPGDVVLINGRRARINEDA